MSNRVFHNHPNGPNLVPTSHPTFVASLGPNSALFGIQEVKKSQTGELKWRDMKLGVKLCSWARFASNFGQIPAQVGVSMWTSNLG